MSSSPLPAAPPVGDKAIAAQMAQEARLFRALYQRRRHQHAEALAEARRAAAEASVAERELVFATDRAEFARDQLKRLDAPSGLSATARRPDEFSTRWQQMEHERQLETTEAILKKHQELRSELCLRRQRSALAVARLRAMRGLCEFGLSGVASGGSLASTMRRCEEDLLTAGCSRPVVEPLAVELEAASPLGLAVPLLQGKKLGDSESSTMEAFRTVAAGWPRAEGEAEEARLRRLVQELADQREALRGELREERAVVPHRYAMSEVLMLRRELADAYEALAELDDPSLEGQLVSLRARCEETQAEHVALEARIVEARVVPSLGAGAVFSGSEIALSAAELTVRVARNQSEIAELRERLRVEEQPQREHAAADSDGTRSSCSDFGVLPTEPSSSAGPSQERLAPWRGQAGAVRHEARAAWANKAAQHQQLARPADGAAQPR